MESEKRFIAATVRDAAHAQRSLRIRGSGSKDFYGNTLHGELLSLDRYRGVVDYDPAELILTARAGTALHELEDLLAASEQLLPFEPPHFGGGTLGGSIATGLSGPRRAYAGSARDFVLGVHMIDGHGNEVRFGGQVMKNVAGYDVSRLMVGAMGTLGVLLQISLKVWPVRAELTLRFACDQRAALSRMQRWSLEGLPLSASCHYTDELYVRFVGSEATLRKIEWELGGQVVDDGAAFWRGIRDHSAEFFGSAATLWRISVPATTAPLYAGVPQLIEWGGALRWLSGDLDAAALRSQVEACGGHVTLFRTSAGRGVPVFHPLKPPIARLHRQLKLVFDPRGIFNPRRMDSF